jgi:hypothetical protein
MDEVKHVPEGEIFIPVNEGDLAGDAALGKGVAVGGTNSAGTHNNNFAVYRGIYCIHFISSY